MESLQGLANTFGLTEVFLRGISKTGYATGTGYGREDQGNQINTKGNTPTIRKVGTVYLRGRVAIFTRGTTSMM